jgi:hypothetical protein
MTSWKPREPKTKAELREMLAEADAIPGPKQLNQSRLCARRRVAATVAFFRRIRDLDVVTRKSRQGFPRRPFVVALRLRRGLPRRAVLERSPSLLATGRTAFIK